MKSPQPHSGANADGSAQRGPIRVGVGGWVYAPWRDNFYPADLLRRLELDYASRHLRVIEVNGTYYSAQKPATYAKWAEATPPGFVFSLKAPRYITESRPLAHSGKGVDSFIHGGIEEMGDRLGPILWQLPPSRKFDADDLDAFLQALPRVLNGRPLRHVLEVRNPGFLCPAYVELARKHAIPTVFTDSPKYPSLADLTGDFVYARLMRSAEDIATGYDAAALDQWAAHARAWATGHDIDTLPHVGAIQPPGPPREVFVFFISSAKLRNPAAAMALQERVDRLA
jgi:uncharacterized protein YecE (DUF72 family)